MKRLYVAALALTMAGSASPVAPALMNPARTYSKLSDQMRAEENPGAILYAMPVTAAGSIPSPDIYAGTAGVNGSGAGGSMQGEDKTVSEPSQSPTWHKQDAMSAGAEKTTAVKRHHIGAHSLAMRKQCRDSRASLRELKSTLDSAKGSSDMKTVESDLDKASKQLSKIETEMNSCRKLAHT